MENQFSSAFNTQVCEQLNAWLGGFEPILKKMKPGNFNWIIHVMLFFHTQNVHAKQKEKEKKADHNTSEDDEDNSEEESI